MLTQPYGLTHIFIRYLQWHFQILKWYIFVDNPTFAPGTIAPVARGDTSIGRWRGRAAGGWKPDPVSNRSAHKKYTLSQYTLLKTFIYMHTLWEGEGGGESFAIERWFKVRWYWYGRTLYSAVYHHTFIKICCVPHAPSLVPRSRTWHKHCGLGTRLGSNPVINGVARQ